MAIQQSGDDGPDRGAVDCDAARGPDAVHDGHHGADLQEAQQPRGGEADAEVFPGRCHGLIGGEDSLAHLLTHSPKPISVP